MLVETLLPAARKRLVIITEDAPLIQAAMLLRAGIDLVVVCGPAGTLTGVITKTDIVNQISQCQGGGCMAATSSVMARDVVLCRAGDRLEDVWSSMKAHGLKNIPITDQAARPVGVLNARDVLQVLLQNVQYEDCFATM